MALTEFHQKPVSLDVNKVCFVCHEQHDIPRCVKNPEKVKALWNGVNARNVEEWTPMLSA